MGGSNAGLVGEESDLEDRLSLISTRSPTRGHSVPPAVGTAKSAAIAPFLNLSGWRLAPHPQPPIRANIGQNTRRFSDARGDARAPNPGPKEAHVGAFAPSPLSKSDSPLASPLLDPPLRMERGPEIPHATGP